MFNLATIQTLTIMIAGHHACKHKEDSRRIKKKNCTFIKPHPQLLFILRDTLAKIAKNSLKVKAIFMQIEALIVLLLGAQSVKF